MATNLDDKRQIATPINPARGGKIIELDIMKFYGVLLVIFGHVANCYTDNAIVHPAISSDFMCELKDTIYAFHMPMFIFVSGYIFAYQLEVKKRRFSLSQLVNNKFKRLIIPYICFALLWVLPIMCILGLRQPLPYAIGLLFGIDSRHLWYVMFLFEAFVLLFCILWCCTKLKIPKWFIVVPSLCMYMLPMLPYSLYFNINSLMSHFVWFTMGYVFVLYKDFVKHVAVVAFLLCLIHYFTPLCLPQKLVVIINAFVGTALFYVLSLISKNLTKYKWYQVISRNSFGIYLFHAMIIYTLEFFFISYSISPILLSLIVFTLSLFASIVLTEFVRKVRLGVIVGE